jgi:hypothetical protein
MFNGSYRARSVTTPVRIQGLGGEPCPHFDRVEFSEPAPAAADRSKPKVVFGQEPSGRAAIEASSEEKKAMLHLSAASREVYHDTDDAPSSEPEWTWQSDTPPPVELPEGMRWEWDKDSTWTVFGHYPAPTYGYVCQSGTWFEWSLQKGSFLRRSAVTPRAAAHALAAALFAAQEKPTEPDKSSVESVQPGTALILVTGLDEKDAETISSAYGHGKLGVCIDGYPRFNVSWAHAKPPEPKPADRCDCGCCDGCRGAHG